MKTLASLVLGLGSAVALLLFAASAVAEEFSIQLDDTVAVDQPAIGAGRLAPGAYTDLYTFTAGSNQIVFFEEIELAAALKGWLRWELKTPSNRSLFSQLFTPQIVGRKVLPESGLYSIRFFMSQEDPAHVGDYSFKIHAVPPDQTFPISTDTTVSQNTPTPGAGDLEMAGTEDHYEFSAVAGQSIFFEELQSAPAFEGSLRWACLAPNGQTVFSGLFKPQGIGRKTLPLSGVYTLRFFVSDANPDHFGSYSFRLRPIPQDPDFAIGLGATVTNGVPAPGAGNLESPGAEDRYLFSGTAGQSVFFEELAVDANLRLALRWECRSPSGGSVFSRIFVVQGTGRITLPETGTYTIRCYVSDNDPSRVGTYSFRTTPIQPDTVFAMRIGDVIAAGTSAPGTGQIEEAGSQDTYTFTGVQSQELVIQTLEVEEALKGALRWELKSPSGTVVFTQIVQGPPFSQFHVLPENGTYSLRLYTSGTDPGLIGGYSFRTFTPVAALPDHAQTTPGTPLAIPVSSLLCNDQYPGFDTVDIELPGGVSSKGGSVNRSTEFVIYSPPPGFEGVDQFDYRLKGSFGGISTNHVTVDVASGGTNIAAVVSLRPAGSGAIALCLLGRPGQTYRVEAAADFVTWTATGTTLTADEAGRMEWVLSAGTDPARFFRVRSL